MSFNCVLVCLQYFYVFMFFSFAFFFFKQKTAYEMRISDWSSDVCSSDLGWGYLADLAREQRDGDTVFEQDGVRIFVDADSLALVDGTRIDFLKQGLNEQFVFENPNVAAECGCGESFTTDADRAA